MNGKKNLSLYFALLLAVFSVVLIFSGKIQHRTVQFEKPQPSQQSVNLPAQHVNSNPIDYPEVKALRDSTEPSTDEIDGSNQERQFSAGHTSTDSSPAPPKAWIYGTVVNQANLPIQGVVVKQAGQHAGTVTDASGHYALPVTFVGNDYPKLKYLKSGYREIKISVTDPHLSSTGRIRRDKIMEYSTQTSAVSGWIGEFNGTTVEGAEIRLSSLPEGFYYSAVSDSSGHFLLEGVRMGRNYTVTVNPPAGYKPISLSDLAVTAETVPLLITLESVTLTTVQGTVVDSLGAYVPNLKINIRSETDPKYQVNRTTDDSGRFELEDFPMGEIRVTTDAPNYFKVNSIKLTESSYTNIIVPIDLGSHELSGWVRDKNGLPLKAARAVLDAEYEIDGVITNSVRMQMTDETGFFRFADLGSGERYITVYAKGFISQGLSYNTGTSIEQLYFHLLPMN